MTEPVDSELADLSEPDFDAEMREATWNLILYCVAVAWAACLVWLGVHAVGAMR